MTTYDPLITKNGRIYRLPPGDELNVSAFDSTELENTSGSDVVIGSVVYSNGPGTFDLAEATALASAKAIGLCRESITANASGTIQTGGVLTLTEDQWDIITGDSGGLEGAYFLDINAGKLTSSAPTSEGQFVTYIGRTLSSTDLLIEIANTIRL